MKFNLLKHLELTGKRILNWLMRKVFPNRSDISIAFPQIQKILILRLDQRIGNGILLLPLFKAIKVSKPDCELHLLIHHPVAHIFQKYTSGLIDTFYPYHQKELLHNPLKLLSWLFKLRREEYDLIISSHNPDNFSLSQAILGKWCKSGLLAGFSHGDSQSYYDIAVESHTSKHYSDAQLDIWRHFDPDTLLTWGGLKVDGEEVKVLFESLDLPQVNSHILIWLGATGDKFLSPECVEYLYEKIQEILGLPIQFSLGESDISILSAYPQWIKNQTFIWDRPLEDTVLFFSGFRAFISGDTGPMHLAVALNLPTITIFRKTNIHQYGYNDGVRHFSVSYVEKEEEKSILIDHLQKINKLLTHADQNVPHSQNINHSA